MKKQILNFGKKLSKSVQKEIFGGHILTHAGNIIAACKIGDHLCVNDDDCPGSCTCIDDMIYGNTCS